MFISFFRSFVKTWPSKLESMHDRTPECARLMKVLHFFHFPFPNVCCFCGHGLRAKIKGPNSKKNNTFLQQISDNKQPIAGHRNFGVVSVQLRYSFVINQV